MELVVTNGGKGFHSFAGLLDRPATNIWQTQRARKWYPAVQGTTIEGLKINPSRLTGGCILYYTIWFVGYVALKWFIPEEVILYKITTYCILYCTIWFLWDMWHSNDWEIDQVLMVWDNLLEPLAQTGERCILYDMIHCSSWNLWHCRQKKKKK